MKDDGEEWEGVSTRVFSPQWPFFVAFHHFIAVWTKADGIDLKKKTNKKNKSSPYMRGTKCADEHFRREVVHHLLSYRFRSINRRLTWSCTVGLHEAICWPLTDSRRIFGGLILLWHSLADFPFHSCDPVACAWTSFKNLILFFSSQGTTDSPTVKISSVKKN